MYLTRESPSYNKAIFALFSGSFISFMILYSVQTLFPIFTEEFNVSPATASLSLSISTGFLAVTMLVASSIADSIGKKRMMSISIILTSVLCILSAFSPNFTILLFLRALQGIALAGFPGIAMAYVNEEFHPKTLGLVMGLHVSGNTLGGLSGRFLTSLFTEWFSWHVALFILGFISLLLSIGFLKLLPQPENSPKTSKASLKTLLPSIGVQLKNLRLLCLFGLSFVLMGSFVTVYNYLGFLLLTPPYSLSHTVIGFIFFVYLVGTFSSTYIGRLSDQHGKSKMIIISIIIMFAGAVLTLTSNVLFIILALCIFTFGFFGCHSIASRWVGEIATSFKSQASSIYLLFYYMGSSVIGLGGGLIWKHFEWSGIVLMIASFISIGLLLIFSLLRFKKQENTTPIQAQTGETL
ncbi:MFS transporter [Halalkalibacter flavus]|uniref:MFS transporter n=1 Tax=Halalkalibacter flavus TaxID=3090668 RepID=UPI002FC6968E